MKLSVSAYRAHASAHKKILDTAYQLNYGSTAASHYHHNQHHPTTSSINTSTMPFQIDPPSNFGAPNTNREGLLGKNLADDGGASSDDARTPLQSPRSQNTSREEEDESSNANESDTKSPSQRFDEEETSSVEREYNRKSSESAKVATQSWKNLRAVMAYYNSLRKIKRTKSNQRWMKLRTTVQISSAMQKKPPLKREDSFLQRFSTRQIPEAQETVEDTGSEGNAGDAPSSGARRRRRPRKQPRTVVNPDENFYFYWLLILTVCILYNLWTLIVRQSFPELQQLIGNFWIACDSLSDVFFVLDVCVQLRTGYLEQGLMVYDSRKLAKHYLTSRAFLLDLAALCPLDLIQLRLGSQPLLRCPRFFKVYRAVNYYYMVESRTVYPNLWRVINLIHILLILAHWFGCFYFLLSQAEGFQGDWVYPYRPGDYATLTRKYLGSLYWSTLTLTTIGDLPTPETNAEYIFTIVSYLIGVFIFATIVGQVGNVITNRNANRLEFERLLDGAKTYMRHHKVPGGMKRRVLRWYDYSWSRGRIQGGGDINTALGLLPDKLKTELALHVNLSVLKKVTIFQECQPEFLRDLVLKMKAYIFTPGDSICRKGEVAREMFIIADGILEVLSETGKVLTTMKAGDFFGEIGILNLDGLNKRTADVRSVGYSELFSLSREDVLAAMKDYPEAQEILQALGRKRLMEVKASARHPPKDTKGDHHHGGHAPDPRSIVGKIKNEAKGLRNALRKTRTHRRSQESLELEPLHSSNNGGGKGVLKRMSRVKSHDLSQEDNQTNNSCEERSNNDQVSSPLGAGLPLLARLRLLKEKQEHEEKHLSSQLPVASPSILSPSPSSVKSPPPIPEEVNQGGVQQEVIGAGLPLLQRLLLLKAKDEKNLGESENVTPDVGKLVPTQGKSSQKPKISFKDRLKIMNKDNEREKNDPPWSKLKRAAIVKENVDFQASTEKPTLKLNEKVLTLSRKTKQYRSIDDLSPEYGGLPFVKKLKILNERQKLEELETVMKTRSFSLDIPDSNQETNESLTRSQSEGSTMHHQTGNKNQLSANLLLVPSSLNSSSESNETPERRNLKSILKKLTETSNGKNEKNFFRRPQDAKSTSTTHTDQQKTPPKQEITSDSVELKKLMRAPTIEGYMARHSKLSKSVTFNRDTLQSPPNSATIVGTNGGGVGSLFSFQSEREPIEKEGMEKSFNKDVVKEDIEDDNKNKLEKCGIQLITTSKTNHQMKLIKTSLEDEQHQYFGDIVLAIKQVMTNHLQELQEKFHNRFERLEDEIRRRDEIINQLRSHIVELERTTEESLTDSIETVISTSRERSHSWDDRNKRESEELRELPAETLKPHPVWSSRRKVLHHHNNNNNNRGGGEVEIEIDSNTDTEDDTDGKNSSSEPEYYQNSSSNWEIELLAAQIREGRERRSASLDPNSSRPIRKRFGRGNSAEHKKD
ncbi:uncharacterized protein [Onthophagus taurus]|uniref:uncharacterized protein isoform X4 n=1 Tax=Onthophagus taurus TaxID=166361 RepID=UPI0039BDD3A7